MTVIAAQWTLDEYHRMIQAGLLVDRQVELIKGDIIEMPPEGEPHAFFSSRSGNYLVKQLDGLAEIRHAKPITLPNQSEPEPDLAIVRTPDTRYREHHPYPEDIFWLVEYSETTLKKDLELKSLVYAEAEIPEYWVVDLNSKQITIFRHPIEGHYTFREIRTEGQLSSLAFPSVAIDFAYFVQ